MKLVGRLAFISTCKDVFKEADAIYIAVGTPGNESGSANLMYVEEVVTTIALTAKKDTIVVTKSPVPGGTNDRLLEIIGHNKLYHINIGRVSNPELLKEESAIYDAFHGERIFVGANNEEAINIIKNSDVALIFTNWDEIKNVELAIFYTIEYPFIIDSRICFDLARTHQIEYYSIGRSVLYPTIHEYSVNLEVG